MWLVDCPACNGEGAGYAKLGDDEIYSTCFHCEGSGMIEEDEEPYETKD